VVCTNKPNFDCDEGDCVFYYAGDGGTVGAGFILEVIASVAFLVGSSLAYKCIPDLIDEPHKSPDLPLVPRAAVASEIDLPETRRWEQSRDTEWACGGEGEEEEEEEEAKAKVALVDMTFEEPNAEKQTSPAILRARNPQLSVSPGGTVTEGPAV
jgi:hypothetical protein